MILFTSGLSLMVPVVKGKKKGKKMRRIIKEAEVLLEM